MIEIGLAGARCLQFAAAALLCGVPIFALYGLTPAAGAAERTWIRRLMRYAVITGLIGAGLMLLAESAEMSGDPAAGLNPETVWSVASGTHFGAVWTVRLVLLLIMGVLVLTVSPGKFETPVLALGGALVAASLAWLGHGGEGGPSLGDAHLIGDVMHVLAASIWIGALVVLARLLVKAEATDMLYGLTQFSGVGSIVVAVLVLTGILNVWALTAPRPLGEAIATPYGLVLLIKLGLFGVMLALAALNRFVLTPRLAIGLAGQAGTDSTLAALRRNIIAETTLAALVIVAVAALGVIEPPNAG